MLFLPLLLAAFAPASHPAPTAQTTCATHADLYAPTLLSVASYRVTLGLHTEDDHGSNTHLCQSNYSLSVRHPDGSTTSNDAFFGNDDAWDRPITFHLDGFTKDGKHLLLTLSEGGSNPMLEIILFDLEANTWEIADLLQTFATTLSRACVADLYPIGTTLAGDIVIAAPDKPGCRSGSRWQVSVAGSDTGAPLAAPPVPLPDSTKVLPLDPGTTPHLGTVTHARRPTL